MTAPHHYLAQGNSILTAFADVTVPAICKSALAEFHKVHGGYVKAGAEVEAALGTRDAALTLVAAYDDVLHAAIGKLADAMVGAGVAERKSPFKGRSKYAPTEMVSLGYLAEVKAAKALCKKLAPLKPKGALKKAIDTTLSAAVKVDAALQALAKPESRYHKLVRTRDGMLVGWTDALGKLRRRALVAFEDSPAVYTTLFAEPPPVVEGKKAPKKKKPKGGDAGPTPVKAGKGSKKKGRKGKKSGKGGKGGKAAAPTPTPTTPTTPSTPTTPTTPTTP